MSDPTSFFVAEGNRYRPTALATGPWDPQSLHGRVITGLIAHQVEADHADPEFQPARLTVDMFRVAPRQPMTLTTRVARDGNRIRVVDISMADDVGTEMARGSCVLLRRAEQPTGEVWSPGPWDVPAPDTLEPRRSTTSRLPMIWEMRPIEGEMGKAGRKRMWTRELYPLVAGIETSPFVRAAEVADYTNPLANSGSEGLQFVNADATMYLHRPPRSEWIGIDVMSHHSTDGVAIAECGLFDLDGLFARSSVSSVANRRR
ncbi:MAG: thioesterase family protein [Chloroflexi bacterium]|nr:thioesterase family protein [Chloroflexota bacterium]